MLRRHFLAGLTLCAVAGSRVAFAAPLQETFEGRIAAVSAKAVTVLTKKGENVEIMIADDCLITINGTPVMRSELGVGQMVIISAVQEGTTHVAKRIDAKT